MPQLDKLLLAHALTMGLDAPDQIEVVFRQGRQRVCVVFDGVRSVPAPEVVPLSPMAAKILQVIDGLDDGESMLGKQIAAEAGYAFSSRIRACLAELVSEKKIKQFPGGGYGRFQS